MAEEMQTNEVQQDEKEKKGVFGKLAMTILLLLVVICVGISGLWMLKLNSQVSSLSSELKTLQTQNYRLDLVENKLAKMEIQNRLQTIERSIGDISRLADFFKQTDVKKAEELQNAVDGLASERDLLQKQLDNYQQVIEKPLGSKPDVPSLQAASETSQPELEQKGVNTAKTTPNWWQKIVNFRLFHGGK